MEGSESHIIDEADGQVSACRALISVAASRKVIEPLPAGLAHQWHVALREDVEAVLERRIKVGFQDRRRLAFYFAEQLAVRGLEHGSRDELALAVRALIDGIWLVASSSDIDSGVREAALAASLRLVNVVKHPAGSAIRRRAAAAELSLTRSRERLPEALGLEWTTFGDLAGDISRGLQSEPVGGPFPERSLPSAAASLMDFPAESATISSAPVYDTTDAALRVSSVTLAAFRGSPMAMSVDFDQRGRPTSALVLGDNGTGKSTLADAIEFGLQGRIGRSVAFDSPLAPAAASFAAHDLPHVVINLNDRSSVSRRLTEREDGKLLDSGEPIRPGFRLAPIALKRRDILRFLDTGALARGHVFFDYFPLSAEEMAVRPEMQLEQLDDEEYRLRINRSRLVREVAERLQVPAEVIATGADQFAKILRERLTGGVPIGEARENGIWDQVDEAIRVPAETLLTTMRRLAAIKRSRERGPETLNPVRYRTHTALIAQALDGIGDHLTAAFRSITGARHIQRIDVVFGRSGPVALDVVVTLASGRRCFPQQVFSEAYQDLIAILFFLAIAKRAAEHGQAKVLILDDVFQSVDATIRTAAVNHLLDDFGAWQLIVTVHDRLWFEQLRTAFAAHQHPYVVRELRHWDFGAGPRLLADSVKLTSGLEHQLLAGTPRDICGAAGPLLEQACDQLSWRLGSSITRREGDKYTLHDLWPSIRKKVRGTTVDQVCAAIDQLYQLRNLAGAHYNHWAESLSLAEATHFAESVLTFVNATWCPECHDWVRNSGKAIQCRGAHLII
jgi:hypothetical protein